MGRKSKLTPELQQEIIHRLVEGHFIEIICKANHIADSSYYEWLKKGEKQTSGKYHDFWEAIQEAEAKAEMNLFDKVDDPKWVLERRFGKRWAKKDKVEVTGEDGKELTIQVQYV